MIRKLVAILALSTSLVGCCNQTLPQPKPTPTGAPFLPHYLAQLQGKEPMLQNRCYPKTLPDLLIACDDQGMKP